MQAAAAKEEAEAVAAEQVATQRLLCVPDCGANPVAGQAFAKEEAEAVAAELALDKEETEAVAAEKAFAKEEEEAVLAERHAEFEVAEAEEAEVRGGAAASASFLRTDDWSTWFLPSSQAAAAVEESEAVAAEVRPPHYYFALKPVSWSEDSKILVKLAAYMCHRRRMQLESPRKHGWQRKPQLGRQRKHE